MSIRERLSGNEATAIAMKQINPDVVAAFPITPSTEIPQYFSTFVSNGEVDTEFVAVESEHSAMSATIGAEAAGAKRAAHFLRPGAGRALLRRLKIGKRKRRDYAFSGDRLPSAGGETGAALRHAAAGLRGAAGAHPHEI